MVSDLANVSDAKESAMKSRNAILTPRLTARSATRFSRTAGHFLLLGWLAAGWAAPASAVVFRVGIGAGCTHATLADAVAAAAANGPDEDSIYIASPAVALSGLIDVDNQSLLIFGGFASCTAATATGRTTITGGGTNDAFWARNASAEIRSFALSRITVDMSGGLRRPLRIDGLESVVLVDTHLFYGTALDGGNVWMNGAAMLQLYGGSKISLGFASGGDGGGIHCAAGGTVVLADGSSIFDNLATAAGGGIYANACILSIEGTELSGNQANEGGGIFAINDSDVTLQGIRPSATTHLARLTANSATQSGGGIALWGSHAGVHNARIAGNSAGGAGGGAMVASGSLFFMSPVYDTCSDSRECSVVEGNSAAYGGGLTVTGASTANIRETRLSGNFTTGGGEGSVAGVANSSMYFEAAELSANHPPTAPADDRSRIDVTYSGTVFMDSVTVYESTVAPGVGVFHAEPTGPNPGYLLIRRSIIQAARSFSTGSRADTIDCVIAREIASFPIAGTRVTQVVDPAEIFVDPAAQNLHISRFSPAEDYCTGPGGAIRDLDQQVFGYQDGVFPDLFGPYDIGADEWRPEIFADGFENGDSYRWSAQP